MTIKDAYEKYKHLNALLSDPSWLPHDFQSKIVYDLWASIKQELAEKPVYNCVITSHSLPKA